MGCWTTLKNNKCGPGCLSNKVRQSEGHDHYLGDKLIRCLLPYAEGMMSIKAQGRVGVPVRVTFQFNSCKSIQKKENDHQGNWML